MKTLIKQPDGTTYTNRWNSHYHLGDERMRRWLMSEDYTLLPNSGGVELIRPANQLAIRALRRKLRAGADQRSLTPGVVARWLLALQILGNLPRYGIYFRGQPVGSVPAGVPEDYSTWTYVQLPAVERKPEDRMPPPYWRWSRYAQRWVITRAQRRLNRQRREELEAKAEEAARQKLKGKRK